MNEDEKWKLVVINQNLMGEYDCGIYINRLVHCFGNAVTPDADQRIETLKSLRLWKVSQ